MNHNYLLGLDVGGTKVECTLLKLDECSNTPNKIKVFCKKDKRDLTYSILKRERIKTNRIDGYDPVIKNISELIKKVISESDISLNDLAGIGIGLPGSVHPLSQVMLNGNSGIFINKDIKKDLFNLLETDKKISIENDANLFALSETLCGVGRDHEKQFQKSTFDQTSIGIILGTGVGGGIIIQGKMLQGANGGGGEIGHTNLFTNGHSCYCKDNGCAEQYLSGPAIEASYASRMHKGVETRPSSKEIFKLFKEREPLALAVINEYKKNLSLFLTKLTNIFDPDFFVLGGGVSNQDEIYQGLEEYIKTNSFVPVSNPKIYKNKLGDSSGVIGASILPLL